MQRINKEHIVPAALLPAFALLAAILPAVFSLTGCGLQQTAQAETGTPEGIVSDEPGIYDSADTAVLLHCQYGYRSRQAYKLFRRLRPDIVNVRYAAGQLHFPLSPQECPPEQ